MVQVFTKKAGFKTIFRKLCVFSCFAGFGYSGFLTGPVILGFIAEGYGLHTSYYSLLGAIIAVLITALFLILNPKK